MKNVLLIFILLIPLCCWTQVNHPLQSLSINGSNGFTLQGSSPSELTGTSVSDAGDINGDGRNDFLIGAYLADENGQTDVGKVYVIFGQTGVFDPITQLSRLNGSNGFSISGKNSNNELGWAVSNAGDFNNDNFDDILLSAPGVTVNGKMNAGETYLIFGKATGFTATFDLSTLNGSNGFTIQGAQQLGLLGHAIDGIGDMNNDNFDDIIISAPFATPNSQQGAGISYVIFGNDVTSITTLDVANLNGTNGFSINGTAAFDFSGYAISAAGNFNNDNFDDVLIGAYGVDIGGNADVGKSYLIYGHGGIYPSSVELSTLNGMDGFSINGVSTGDFTGWAVTDAGDMNQDNFGDLLISAPAATANGNAQAGKTYVVFGNNTNPSSFDLSTLNGTNGFTLNGIAAQNYSGSALSKTGDINGDNIRDILIGAKSASPNGIASGAVYLYFGKSTGYTPTVNLSSLDGTNGLAIYGKNAAHQLGTALSGLGDINGDNKMDFIVGAKGAYINGVAASESYVITDIFNCPADAGLISTATTVSSFEFCAGTDLLDTAGAAAAFMPNYGETTVFDPSAGFEYAMLLVNENNSIVEIDLTTPYDFNFATLPHGIYTIYGFSFKESTINNYLTSIRTDGTADDLNQIRQDDNDLTSGGTGNGTHCLDLKKSEVNGATQQITIHKNPAITANDINICTETPLVLIATSTDAGLNYNWIGPNYTANTQNPTVSTSATTANNGPYTVAVSDANTCTDTAYATVIVHPLPTVAISDVIISDTLAVCIGSAIELKATASETVNYTWTKSPSYTSAEQNPIINNSTSADAGLYTVSVTNPYGCSSETTASTRVFINPLPIITTANITVDEGEEIQLKVLEAVCDTAAVCPDYQWIGPNDYSAKEQNPRVTINASLADAGTYTAYLKDNNNCVASSQLTVTVTPANCSDLALSVETADVTVEEDEQLQLSASFVGGVNYLWTGPNGFSSTEQNPIVKTNANLSDAGNYQVKITTADDLCTTTATAQVTITPFVFSCADAELSVAAADFSVALGAPIQLTASSPTAVSYQWFGPNDFTSNQQNPSLTGSATINSAGNYTVIATDQNGCMEDDIAIIKVLASADCIASIVVSSNPATNTEIQAQSTIMTSGTVVINSPNNVTFKAGQSITLKSGFSVLAGATFSAIIEACTPNSLIQETTIKEAISNTPTTLTDRPILFKNEGLQISPNPFKNQTQISYTLPEEGFVQLVLYNQQGRKIKTLVSTAFAAADQYTVTLQNDIFLAGLYVLVLKTKNELQTKKLIVLK